MADILPAVRGHASRGRIPAHARRNPLCAAPTPASGGSIPARAFRALCIAVVLPATAALAQSPPPLPIRDGFVAATELVVTRRPLGFGGFAPGRLPGELFYAVENDLWRRAPDGTLTLIRSLANQARIGLLTLPPGSATLVHSDFATDEVYLRDVVTGTERVFAGPANTFDIDVTPAGDLLASANPDWPQPGAAAGIWLLDPVGARHREIVRLSGASGPLHVDRRNGDLIYATQSDRFPAPPGSTRILRFAAARLAAAIAGGPPLTAADASVARGRFDGAYDLVADDRGAVFVTDPQHGGILRLHPDGSRDGVVFSPTTGRGTLGLAFLDGDAATFDPWQPATGGRLLVAESDWGTWNAVHAIAPAPPTLTPTPGPTVPPGPFSIRGDGLPRGGTGHLLVSFLMPTLSRPIAWIDGVPLWSALDVSLPPVVIPTPIGTDGRAAVTLSNPGGADFTWSFQWLALPAATTDPSATSPTHAVTFRR